MDRGARQAAVYEVAELDTTEWLRMHKYTGMNFIYIKILLGFLVPGKISPCFHFIIYKK